ncbi:hypothetical protein CONPUDRAFT_169214 [Coniophora puteana RWD-64-598 SS2]|uniref:DUF6534 domain-containing protein n=1 Tax=Coniophora puteana (strain RWD-64-598) TaxID=741705 RepID=A0A5M3M9R5_CONPW|nr:uncharacterized protein CONPUDRAFT_169214 [Coniophora puteana RWD-64-598 SS2]EIW75988.1 hypothetical protein CONPUDRAFT_169214 [Coniophora puteana RWD-64-598 SS2]
MAPTPAEAIMQGPLCGTLATMMLYGIICMQTFQYYQNYERDRKFMKVLVAWVWALETAHTALSIHYVEHYLILNFGNDELLNYAVWSMGASYFIGFWIAYPVNLVFVWRIWLLSRKRWIAAFLTFMATARLGLGLSNCSTSFRYPAWVVFRQHIHATMVSGWTVSACTDTLIASTLCFYLHRQRTGMRRTDTIINELLLYTINTGLVTSLFAIAVLITFLGSSNLAFSAFVQTQSKLYAVSLLATLNTRKQTLKRARHATPTGENFALTAPEGGIDLPPSSTFKPMNTASMLPPIRIARPSELSSYSTPDYAYTYAYSTSGDTGSTDPHDPEMGRLSAKRAADLEWGDNNNSGGSYGIQEVPRTAVPMTTGRARTRTSAAGLHAAACPQVDMVLTTASLGGVRRHIDAVGLRGDDEAPFG